MAADGRLTWLPSVRESAERQMASHSEEATGAAASEARLGPSAPPRRHDPSILRINPVEK
jgi:hypothetical protein